MAAPPADPADRYRLFVTGEGDDTPNLASVLHHLGTAWERRDQPNVHLVHYRDLRHDPVDELLRLAHAVGIEVTPERAVELVAEATLDRMRERAEEVAPSASQRLWRDPRRFIRTGGAGEWLALTTPELDEVYRQRVETLAAPDLARWVHDGARAVEVAR